MEFKKISVGGQKYGIPVKDIDVVANGGMCQSSIDLIQKKMSEYLVKSDTKGITSDSEGKRLHEFYNLLAVCHTVVCDKDQKTGKLTYQASSPDELALTMGAKQVGYELTDRTSNQIFIKNLLNNSSNETYTVHAEFPFDSTRKRMSLIIESEGAFYLMCKGADSIVLPRCKFDSSYDQTVKTNTTKDLYEFAVEGLRTLVMGKRTLTAQQYKTFSMENQRLKISTEPNKDELLNQLYDEMEQGLTYIGSTAIEDKLQDGVPDTIAKLIETDIRVWVLTGDKQETAIEIGKSCKLIQ